MMGLQYPREHRDWVDVGEDKRAEEYDQEVYKDEDFNQETED